MHVIMHIYIDVYIETCGSVFARVSQDLYVDRPLPYLIGSQAFMEQEDVGLGDLSSDGNKLIVASLGTRTLWCLFSSRMCMTVFPEMSVDSDRDSVIESEDGKEAVVRHFFFPSLSRRFSRFLIPYLTQENKHLTPLIHLTAFRRGL